MSRGVLIVFLNSPDGEVVNILASGLVGTGFPSQYWLQPMEVFKGPLGRCKATTPSFL